jgi:hypothetical protein
MLNIDQLAGETGTDLGAVGTRLGLTPDQTRQAMASLLPAVAGGFQKQGDGFGNAAQLAAGTAPHEAVQPGNAVLGQIFGSKDVSRQVAQHASGQTGMSSQIMKALLPVVAAMVAQHLMGRMGGGGASAGGGLGGVLGSVLGGGGLGGAMGGGTGAPVPQPGRGGIGGMLGGLLDRDGDGNPLDDILGGMMSGRR